MSRSTIEAYCVVKVLVLLIPLYPVAVEAVTQYCEYGQYGPPPTVMFGSPKDVDVVYPRKPVPDVVRLQW